MFLEERSARFLLIEPGFGRRNSDAHRRFPLCCRENSVVVSILWDKGSKNSVAVLSRIPGKDGKSRWLLKRINTE